MTRFLSSRRRTILTLAALTLIGLLLRLWKSDLSLVADDWVSLHFGQIPWPDFWRSLRLENTPPLFFFLFRLWIRLVPETEQWLRLMPILISTVSIPIFFLVARRIIRSEAALIATILFTLSAANLTASHMVRAYSLGVLLSLLYLFFLLRWTERFRRQDLARLTLIGLLGFANHYTFIFLPLAGGLTLVTSRALRPHWRPWLISHVIIGTGIGAWLLLTVPGHLASSVAPSWFRHVSTLGGASQVLTWLAAFFPTAVRGWQVAVVGAAGALLILWALRILRSHRSSTAWPIGLSLIHWLAGSGLAAGFLLNIETPKFFFDVYPAWLILVGRLWDRTPQRRLASVCFALLVLGMLSLTPVSFATNGGAWNALAGFIDSRLRPDDLVLVQPLLDANVLRYYSRSPATITGLLPTRYRTDDRFADDLRYNFQAVVNEETINDLGQLTDRFDRVWLLTGNPERRDFNRSDLPVPWFTRNGWTSEEAYGTRPPVTTMLIRFQRPASVNPPVEP